MAKKKELLISDDDELDDHTALDEKIDRNICSPADLILSSCWHLSVYLLDPLVFDGKI